MFEPMTNSQLSGGLSRNKRTSFCNRLSTGEVGDDDAPLFLVVITFFVALPPETQSNNFRISVVKKLPFFDFDSFFERSLDFLDAPPFKRQTASADDFDMVIILPNSASFLESQGRIQRFQYNMIRVIRRLKEAFRAITILAFTVLQLCKDIRDCCFVYFTNYMIER